MRQCLLLALLVCLAQAQDGDEEEGRVDAEVDGIVYSDETEAANALGKWGQNLVDLDADQAVRGKTPNTVRIRARDVKKSKRLSNSAVGYLLQFGFAEAALEKTESELLQADTFIGENGLKKAMKQMQKFYGLKPTGEADQQTLNLMKMRRCGGKDMAFERPNRAKRYTLSRRRWPVHILKYWFDPTKYTADLSLSVVRSEFERALEMWSAHADVSFVEVANEEDAHVKISWHYGDHGDEDPFYGNGGTLAHAFYPTDGLLHFDDAEDYTVGTVLGTNLHYVATHEMGHILGLKHADYSLDDTIMYAIYTGYSDNLQLHRDDIDGVVAAMGAGSGTVTPIGSDGGDTDGGGIHGGDIIEPTVVPAPEDVPDCIVKIDAAIHWDHDPEYVYIFAGDWYYRLKPTNPDDGNNLPILDTDSVPKRIGIDGFTGLPRKIEAAVETLEDVNKFYAFKGDKYFLYDFVRGRVVEDGSLSDLWPDNTPDRIEAAFKINKNTLGFIFGSKLYTYSKAGKQWKVGRPNSNYFDKYDDLSSLSLAFYRNWAWAFRGNYYSVARTKNGKEAPNYIYRSIKPDIMLPMCTEGVSSPFSGGGLTKTPKRKCKKELKKMINKRGNYEPKAECKDYVAERFTQEVEFNRDHFAD